MKYLARVITVGLLLITATASAQSDFLRGDANGDGRVVPIHDGYWLLWSLFASGAPPPCIDATDVNDDGIADIVDVVELLQFGYLVDGPGLPAPGPLACGPDPTVDTLTCQTYTACAGPTAAVVDLSRVYRLPTLTGEAGATVDVVLELDNTSSDDLLGWSVGVEHDPSIVQLTGVALGGDVALLEPDYAEMRPVPGGVVAGVLTSFFQSDFLEPGIDLQLLELTYQLLEPGVSPLSFVDELDNLTLANHVITDFTLTVPETIDGQLTVIPATLFRRGDANGDTLFDIADPIFGIMHLFAGGAPPLCQDAGDANDDGILNIADGIEMLNVLFDDGSPPLPSPGSIDCGVDPTHDGLDCGSPPDCG